MVLSIHDKRDQALELRVILSSVLISPFHNYQSSFRYIIAV